MKNLKQIQKDFKGNALDRRDIARLARFIPENKLKDFGLKLTDEAKGKYKHIAFTRKNVLNQLKADLIFAFTKALNKRGISSSFMYDVIEMWNWILEDGLENFTDYAQYGLPLFKAIALKNV